VDTSSLLQDNNAPIVVSRDKLPVLDHFRFRYFLICPLLTYCCPRYIFFAQDGRRKGGVPEAEVVQNRQFIHTVV